jgi:hypothetical protein
MKRKEREEVIDKDVEKLLIKVRGGLVRPGEAQRLLNTWYGEVDGWAGGLLRGFVLGVVAMIFVLGFVMLCIYA